MKMHQCEKLIEMVTSGNRDIFENMTSLDNRELWHTVIQLMFSIDTSLHFEILKKFTSLVKPHLLFNANSLGHRLLLMQILVKCSQYYWELIPFSTCQKVAQECSDYRSSCEKSQRKMGPDLALEQIGLILMIVRPMVAMATEVFPSGKQLLQDLDANLDRWKLLLDDD
jgi:hypothetical protein